MTKRELIEALEASSADDTSTVFYKDCYGDLYELETINIVVDSAGDCILEEERI